MNDQTDGLAEFVRVLDEGSISSAARALDVPRSTLSRRLGALEDRLGVRLIRRTTRRLAPTTAGEELYRRARRILREAHEAAEAVRRLDGVPRGVLRVSTPPVGIALPLADLFVSFAEAWPEVSLEITTTSRHVDLLAEGVDVALRGGRVRDPALVSRRVMPTRLVALASRAYVARWGLPASVQALTEHDCVHAYDPITERPVREWPLRAGGTVEVTGRIATNDLGIVAWAVAAGHAVGLLPRGFPLPTDDVVEVLPEHVGAEQALSLVYPERKHLDPKVRAFVDHVVARFDNGDTPWERPPSP